MMEPKFRGLIPGDTYYYHGTKIFFTNKFKLKIQCNLFYEQGNHNIFSRIGSLIFKD